MNRQKAQEFVNSFDFAGFSMSVKGLGIYFLGDKAKEQIRRMSKQRAKEVNQAAWKEKNTQSRICNKFCNASIQGNSERHDIASLRYDVAEAVAKESYKVMMGYI